MEPDARYYRRRACEEFAGASRAVTEAARERRLQLLDSYLARLEALGEPLPLEREEVRRMLRTRTLGGTPLPIGSVRLETQFSI